MSKEGLENIRNNMQQACEIGEFDNALELGESAIEAHNQYSDTLSFWEIRDLLRRIYKNGIHDNERWRRSVESDYRRMLAYIANDKIIRKLQVLYVGVVDDYVELCGLTQNSIDALTKAINVLTDLSPTAKRLKEWYIKAATLCSEMGYEKLAEDMAGKGLHRFRQDFPITSYNYRRYISQYAQPLCDVLDITWKDVRTPNKADFEQLCTGSTDQVGVALHFIDTIILDYPELKTKILDTIRNAIEDIDEHEGHVEFYQLNKQELQQLLEKVSGYTLPD